MDKLIPEVLREHFRVLTYRDFQNFNLTVDTERRTRPLDTAHVRKLADSIKVMTMLNPIIITDDGRPQPLEYTLVAGWHRLEAVKLLWQDQDMRADYALPIRIVSINAAGDARRRVEIEDNLCRKDPAGDERKHLKAALASPNALAAHVPGAALMTPTGRVRSWFAQWAADIDLPERTATNRWHEYREKNSLGSMLAKDAPPEHQEAFKTWVAETAPSRKRGPYKPRKPTVAVDDMRAMMEEMLAEKGIK